MSMPFYVPPEQVMKDRADFARKGIARGRSVIVVGYDRGIAFVAENPSRALHKVSEIYDRIAFAAVGRYNEFESLRVAGIRYADLRGYSYDRTDVTARALANTYAQTLGAVFTQESKPFEIEIVVAEVGVDSDTDQIFRLTYDGSVADEQGFVAMGGASDAAEERLGTGWRPGMTLAEVLRLAVDVLGAGENGERRALDEAQLEVAVLDRDRPRRSFRRIVGPLLTRLLGDAPGATGDSGAPGAPTEVAATEPPAGEGGSVATGETPDGPASPPPPA
ncbi:proteasome subunit alpha [Terrabacter sp. LjRoot27]|uniref:proteasome subunit alpha n=1 Tax=Terrabacter sp. LjRoot27 TaxID=3342306 RepID=UPI003ECEDED5